MVMLLDFHILKTLKPHSFLVSLNPSNFIKGMLLIQFASDEYAKDLQACTWQN